MAWQVDLESRAGYLFARISGPADSVEITLGYWRELAEACRQRGSDRLMVVDELEGEPFSEEQLGRLIARMHEENLGFDRIRVAFVEPVSTHLRHVEHGEILAQERGFPTRVFGDEGAAERWLLFGGD